MKLTSYIDKEYLNEIEEVFTTPQSINDIDRIIPQQSILATLLASEIKTNLSERECIKYFKSAQDLTRPFASQSWKEKIIYEAISKDKFKRINNISFSDPNGVYFIKNDNQKNRNVAVIKEFKNCEVFYSSQTGNISIDKYMNGVASFKHQANSLLIYDPYFFVDSPGLLLQPKIPNVITLLQTIVLDQQYTYYLSIVAKDQRTKDERNNGVHHNDVIYQKLDELQNAFPNLEISAFVPFDNIFGSNRYLFTNYVSGFSNHLFDRQADLSIDFIFRELAGKQQERIEKIKHNYVKFNKEIGRIKNSYMQNSGYAREQQIKFGDILQNPIFAA